MTFTIADIASQSGTDQLPLIGYKNLFRRSDATVTASSESSGFEASNAYDWLPHTSWLPASAGASTLTASFGSSQPADYLGIYNSNIHQNSGSVKVEYSQDGGTTWTTAAEQVVGSVARAIIFLTWDKVHARDWRFTVTSSTASNIPVLALGELLTLWGGMSNGSRPPILARDTELRTNTSVKGVFLGRSVRKYGSTPQIATVDMPESWVTDHWLPFVVHAEKKPFFYVPNYGPHAGAAGAALAWSDGSIPAPTYSDPGFLRVSMSMQAHFGEQQIEVDDA